MLLHYFGHLGRVGAYVSIGLLVAILATLLVVKPSLVGRLDMQAVGSTTVQKMLKLGIRSSVSFAVMIIFVCFLT